MLIMFYFFDRAKQLARRNFSSLIFLFFFLSHNLLEIETEIEIEIIYLLLISIVIVRRKDDK